MAYESKYGKITTEKGSIPEDEPVFLLRGQDVLAAETIRSYLVMCEQAHCPPQHIEGVYAVLERFETWQESHATKLPGTVPFETVAAEEEI